MNNVTNILDSLLGKVNLDDVTSSSNENRDLPEGYYLCEVEDAVLGETKDGPNKGMPLVTFTMKVTEDGLGLKVDDSGNAKLVDLKNTANKKMWIHYSLKDEDFIKRFVSDMLKFEGDVEDEPLLEKECFLNSELLLDALEILKGMRIYIHLSTSKKNGETQTWKNLISWKRARALELPM